MLYSQEIKNIVMGVSQQPPLLRSPEQLDEQINGFSTEASGLQKRPPTQVVKALANLTVPDNAYIHWLNRDEAEQYIMIFNGTTCNVYDFEGNQKSITAASGTLPYIQTTDPLHKLRTITIADYTFIINKDVTCAMDTAKTSSSTAQGGMVVVKSGQYGKTYRVGVDGTVYATLTLPTGATASDISALDTTGIAQTLYNQCVANATFLATYNIQRVENWIQINRKDTNRITLATEDGFGQTALIAFTDSIQYFDKLPATAPDGYRVAILGDPTDSAVSAYWTQYDSTKKIWKECVAPNLLTTINPATMPHVIKRLADGSFQLVAIDWDLRNSGDDDSNSEPSFIGQTLNDVFFFRNRLGVLAGENVILSENGNFFNFWLVSATSVQDTDCIDLPTTTTRINKLLYAVPWDSALYLFSDSTQFILSSDTVLTPRNSALIEVTGFSSAPDCRPVVAGKNVYFAAERSEYSSIKEYYNVQSVSDVKNAQDISSHVPSLIPNSVSNIIPNTAENLLLIQTTGDNKSLYIYKYLFLNENRVQSSWSKWDFTDRVYGGFFMGSTLYLLIHRGNQVFLEKIQFTYNTTDFDEEPYRVFLDMKHRVTSMTYDSDLQQTSFDLAASFGIPYASLTYPKYGIVTQKGEYFEATLKEIQDAAGIFKLEGDYTGTTLIVGLQYDFKITMSTIYIRKQLTDGSYKAISNGRLQVINLKLNYVDTGAFRATVKTSYNTRNYTMSTRQFGTVSATLGKTPSNSGTFRIPVHSLNTAAIVSIIGDSPLPLELIGYRWEGKFVPRSKEV